MDIEQVIEKFGRFRTRAFVVDGYSQNSAYRNDERIITNKMFYLDYYRIFPNLIEIQPRNEFAISCNPDFVYIMNCTEFKDRNEDYIWESDRIKDDSGIIWTIVYQHGKYFVKTRNLPPAHAVRTLFDLAKDFNLEIVGNFWQDQENEQK